MDGAVFYYGTEQPGHVAGLVNASNHVTNAYSYTPFGEAITTSEGVAQPLGFTARERDGETGLYYYRARYYDPVLARFVSEDLIGLAGGIKVYGNMGRPGRAMSKPRQWLLTWEMPSDNFTEQ